ncbi:MAG: hypothetical protein PWQ48_1055 [Thermotogaceae bacterium]|nr:hypothetical protein [Thermotogaceae bacterium]
MQIFYRNSVGLEFSDHFLNAVKLKKRGKKVKLIAKASVQLPYELDPQVESESVVEALKRLNQEIKFDVEDLLVVNLKADNVLFRKISLPRMNKAQIINAARFQINRELMIPVEEIVIDTYEIETKNSMVDYGVFIARNTYINSLVNTLKKAGFDEPDVIDVDYLKYLHLAEVEELTGYNFLVIESLSGLFVMLVINGKLSLIESSSISLDDVMNILIDNYGVTNDEALSILRNGSEIGAFGKQISEFLEFHYRETVYETEKLLRSIMGSNEIPQNVKIKIFLLSLNERLTNEFVKYAREIGLVDGSSISAFPFRKNVPVTGVPLGALGLAYRGVMEIGKGEFVSEEKAKVKV